MDPGDGDDTEDWQPEGISGQCSSSSSIIESQSVSVGRNLNLLYNYEIFIKIVIVIQHL